MFGQMVQKRNRIAPLMLLCALLTGASGTVYAQIQWMASVGSSHFMGDLGGSFSPSNPSVSDLNLRSTRYHIGTGFRFHLHPNAAIRVAGFYARVSADDRYTSDFARRNRNLSFFSPVYGGHAMAEWHFGIGPASEKRFILFVGAEYFHFNPMARFGGAAVRLQPLGTEGQNYMPDKSPYSLNAMALVAGGSYKFFYFPTGFLSLELSGHKTNSDYIDDASTNYPDKALLLSSSGQLAVDMSDRSLGQIEGFSDAGQKRASPNYKDNFIFLSLSVNFNLSGGDEYPSRRQGGFKRLGGNKHSCFSF